MSSKPSILSELQDSQAHIERSCVGGVGFKNKRIFFLAGVEEKGKDIENMSLKTRMTG